MYKVVDLYSCAASNSKSCESCSTHITHQSLSPKHQAKLWRDYRQQVQFHLIDKPG